MLEKNPASVFCKKDLLRKSKEQFEELKAHGFLTYSQPDPYHETYPCTLPCSKGCPMDVVNMEGKFFAICPEDTEVDPIPLTKDDISRYHLSLDMVFKVIREANNFAGDIYPLNSHLHFIGEQVIEGSNTAFILAIFPNVKDAEPHLLSLPTRIAANYPQIVVVTPSLSLTQEPIYAKLKAASISPVILPPSFGQDNYKISYVAALRKPLLAETSGEPGSNIKGMSWQEAQKKAVEYIDANGFPGIDKLYKEVGCVKNTMYKAIKNSRVLKDAKRAYDARRKSAKKTLKAVGLTKKTLAKQEQTTEMSPEMQAQIDSAGRDAMIDEIISKVPREKQKSAKLQFTAKPDDEIRDIYKVFLLDKDFYIRHKQA